jgi:hypothetical protein
MSTGHRSQIGGKLRQGMSNRGLDEPSMPNVITTPNTLTPNVTGCGFE